MRLINYVDFYLIYRYSLCEFEHGAHCVRASTQIRCDDMMLEESALLCLAAGEIMCGGGLLTQTTGHRRAMRWNLMVYILI